MGEENSRTPLGWAGDGWSRTSSLRWRAVGTKEQRRQRKPHVPSGRRRVENVMGGEGRDLEFGNRRGGWHDMRLER